MTDLTVLVHPSPLYHVSFRTKGQTVVSPMVVLHPPNKTEEELNENVARRRSHHARQHSISHDDNLLSPRRTARPKRTPATLSALSLSIPAFDPSQTGTSDTDIPRPSSAPPTHVAFNLSLQPRPRPTRRGSMGYTKGGELIPPPPSLFRPNTFWRRTLKSGVSAPSYSPSTHLVRRSTFVAAGLGDYHNKPGMHDASALGVESRVGTLVLLPDWKLV